MSFDAMVTSPGRLSILTALASEPQQPFVQLRQRTGLTDGNLATHARRLQAAGFVAIQKSIEEGKPLTTLQLTTAGRNALADHARQLLAALDQASTTVIAAPTSDDETRDDDWVD